jgi:hypothetical protein
MIIRGRELLDRAPAEQPQLGLVDAAGRPVELSLKSAEEQRRARLAAAVSAAGDRLFPEADVPPPWADAPPSRELFDTVATTDPAELSDFDLVELLRATGRLASLVEALQVKALAALARRPRYATCAGDPAHRHDHDAAKAAADEVSAAMRWTPSFADGQVRDALALVEELPATLAALATGRIDAYRARVIAEETAPLADRPQLRAKVEAKVLASAETKTGPQVRAHAKKAVITAAPDVAEQRRRRARRSRGVDKPVECGDGMAHMGITGPIEGLAALWLAVDAAARARHTAAAKLADDADAVVRADVGKTLAQQRFDVLADLGWSALQSQHMGCCNPHCDGLSLRLGARHGRAVHLNVTVPANSLLGAAELPGELRGFGPITADAARTLAADATWRRLLTDPASGALLDYGRTTYAPPQALRDHVIARDRTCRFSTCDIDAETADLDHSRPASGGGSTSDANTGPLHRRHHNGKTMHAWRLQQHQPGHYLWISPANHLYEIEPEAVGAIVEFDDYRHPVPVAADPDPPPF